MLQYCTLVTFNAKLNAYTHDEDAESGEVNVRDTGELVTVLEWQGTAYSSGQQVALTGCTLYADDNGNYYTTFDGEMQEDELI